jgi:hypothetical protein
MAQTGYTPIQLYYSTTASTAPLAASLANGELAINITDGKLYYKDNSAAVQVIGWKTVPTSAGGTGLTSYTAGDTLYYASGTTLSKLAIGTIKTILTSTGSAPQWSTSLDTTQGGTGLTSYTAGDLSYYATGTTLTKLAIGAANRVLTSTGSAPQWSTALAGITQLDVDNIRIDGNTISSTDTNGNIVINPDGSGRVLLDTTTTPTLNLVNSGALGIKTSEQGFYVFTVNLPVSTTKTVNIANSGAGQGSVMIMVGGRIAGPGSGGGRGLYFGGGVTGTYTVATISKANSGNLVLGDATVSGSTISFTAQNTSGGGTGDLTVSVWWNNFVGGEITTSVT